MTDYDVTVIGGGPAGLAAAISAEKNGAKTLLIEREARLGGILKQCIHDGFGLVRFGEKLSGPEYALRFTDALMRSGTDVLNQTFVHNITREQNGFAVSIINRDGARVVTSRTIVLATGCRERTAKQAAIHGTRPAGVFTAGTAQRLININGVMPVRKCVILGSGDIGLIMARRLTLEGAEVLGVYEAKPTPSGLTRNICQCLNDFNIPLYLSHTITRVFGNGRLSAVETAKTDESMRPVKGTERIIACDALILSVGLIPENELAESLSVKLNPHTKGPLCDAQLMTTEAGVFSCGNALHVNDLVDYVSESGETAGRSAAGYAARPRRLIAIEKGENVLYTAPSLLDLNADNSSTRFYFRSDKEMRSAVLRLDVNGRRVFEKRYAFLRPPEMQRLVIDFSRFGLSESTRLAASLHQEEAHD